SHIFEHCRYRFDVHVLIERLALVAALGAVALAGAEEPAAAVAAFTVLQADVAISAFHRFRDHFRGLLLAAPGNVVVTGHGIVGASAEHLINGHAAALALDIPQSFIHGADHFVVDRSAAPVGAEVCALPLVLNAIGILAAEPRL